MEELGKILIDKYGIVGVLIFIILLVISNGIRMPTIYNITWINIKRHYLFSLKSFLLSSIDRLSFDDKAKEEVFKIILRNKIEVVIDDLKSEIRDNISKIKKMKKCELSSYLHTLTNNLIENYESKIKNELLEKYGANGERLYKRAYEELFKVYHNTNISWIENFLKDVGNLKIKTNNHIVYDYLVQIYLALSVAINDVEKIFRNTNGELNNLLK